VFTAWYNPVWQSSRHRLSENVTGVTSAFPEVSPKSLEVFRVLLPTLHRVLVPYDAADPKLMELLKALRTTATRLVLLCQILSEHSSLNDSVVIHHTTA
jgi:hypothetical protein